MPDALLTAGGRLRLRRPDRADLESVYALHADPRTNRYNPTGPQRDHDKIQRLLDGWLTGWVVDGISYYVVERAADGVMIGMTGVRHGDGTEFGCPPEPVLNLYYRYRPDAWGHGYAREGAEAVLLDAAERQPDRSVVVVTHPSNTPALRLAAGLGFQHYRDVELDGPAVEWRRPQPAAESRGPG